MPDESGSEGPDIKPWRILASEKLVHDRWRKLRADTCELPAGGTEEITCAFCSDTLVRKLIARGVFSRGLHIASFYMSLDVAG